MADDGRGSHDYMNETQHGKVNSICFERNTTDHLWSVLNERLIHMYQQPEHHGQGPWAPYLYVQHFTINWTWLVVWYAEGRGGGGTEGN